MLCEALCGRVVGVVVTLKRIAPQVEDTIDRLPTSGVVVVGTACFGLMRLQLEGSAPPNTGHR